MTSPSCFPIFAARRPRATFCSLRTRSPAAFGSCSATNHGGVRTPSLTRQPPSHSAGRARSAADGPKSLEAREATKTGAGR
jgi:hypothetical protein